MNFQVEMAVRAAGIALLALVGFVMLSAGRFVFGTVLLGLDCVNIAIAWGVWSRRASKG